MVKLDSLRLDSEKLTDGVWLEHASGLRWKVLRGSDADFEAKLVMALRNETLSEDGDLSNLHDVLVREFITDRLVDWENHEDADGNDIPFDKEVAIELFAGKELKHIFDWFYAESTKDKRFNKEAEAQLVKNSKGSSSGNGTGETKKPASSSKQETSDPGGKDPAPTGA